MATSVIYISLDLSVESVGSSIPRVILIGSISVEVLVAPEVGEAAVASPAEVLELDTHSSSEADPSESSLPPVSVAPMVLPFLCSDDSESDTEMPERHVSPTPHDAMLTRWRSRIASQSASPTTSTLEIPTAPIPPAPSAVVAPSTNIISPVDAPPRIRRRRAILIRPEQDIPIGRLYHTHPGGPCRALTARKSAIKELINQRVAEALAAYEANRAAELVVESQIQNGDDDDNVNVRGNGNGNGGGNGDRNGRGNGNRNGGGNGNGNPNKNDRGAMPVARECTYYDFVKCQPLNFKGTKGVVGLTRWFEKTETVFQLSREETDI
ncbi:hypothetical protein Tco_0608659 [Tanacetum coccineum]